MRLFAQNRTRTGDRNRSLERSFDGLGFALFRHDANHFFRCTERWNGQRQSIRRNGFQTREIPFTDLLALNLTANGRAGDLLNVNGTAAADTISVTPTTATSGTMQANGVGPVYFR